jgi:hypothetical protein
LNYRRILWAVLSLAAIWLLAGCTPSVQEASTTTITTAPAVTAVPEKPAPDAHYCTVTENATGREIAALLQGEEYRFYLPGGVDPTALTLNCIIGEDYTVTVRGKEFTESQQFCINIAETPELTVTFTSKSGEKTTCHYTFLSSSANILCLDIDESKGSISAMHRDKNHETYCYGSLTYVAEEGMYSFDSSFSLKGRGNATWDDEKKGYALKLYEDDSYENKNKVSVSGMGASANWVLLANHRDRTLIRNALAQTLAAKLGMENAVKFVFVDVYMNGEYLGLYNLMQKVESGKAQVDIDEAEADNLKGGYLLEFDNYTDTPQITLDKSGMQVTVKSPDNLESYTAIQNLLNEAETAILAEDGRHPRTGKYWYDYLDKESFAILWIVREYTMDNDATVNFRFYYDPADGLFHAGPAWDFDNAMARNNGVFADPTYPIIESGHRNKACWLRKLMKFDEFNEEIVRLYQKHRRLFTTSHDQSIYALAFTLQKELDYSIGQNFTVWEKQLANKSWNYPDEPTYEAHFEILTDFLEVRNEFWSEYIPNLTN